MLRVGLTGGLASGKSFIGKALEELGCYVIRADELGHQVLLPGGEAYDAVVAAFGTADRRRLASLVFHNPEKLAKLSSIVHPAVSRLQEQETARIAAADPNAIVVVEAAILVETGSYVKFDRLIVAVCTPEQQLERAMKRDSYLLEDAMGRISRQLPLEEKRRVAHFVIDTSGTKENTLEQTRVVYEALRLAAVGQ
ncbi:MAG: dephospho-CoA kinase [Acidobacteriota bacterium]|nr:dephospho-CoA kinase [Acidobacteriota bacterium]